ncbi:hypothetical protein [Paenibacillus xerothermodurans]|uniref:Uncharacterized protein n=1 Tax=Paenibacillus xerothermodurans TaxID=1977292 RepID=A0A2W1NEK0_PAEXE|nr:hypothetical protein [Paenibacillus xerothermodurans]PZE22364.1 hypothetical protein CBW46_000830 [Paenibacillus xerothermodurans]
MVAPYLSMLDTKRREWAGDIAFFKSSMLAEDAFPGLLDISSAGHLAAGESIDDGERAGGAWLAAPFDGSYHAA